jgi:hypothetical protein
MVAEGYVCVDGAEHLLHTIHVSSNQTDVISLFFYILYLYAGCQVASSGTGGVTSGHYQAMNLASKQAWGVSPPPLAPWTVKIYAGLDYPCLFVPLSP